MQGFDHEKIGQRLDESFSAREFSDDEIGRAHV